MHTLRLEGYLFSGGTMDLSSSTALVTGGAVRIGRAICEVLAECGCGVVVHYRESGAEAESLVAVLREAGASAWAVKGGLDSGDEAERLLEDAWDAAGGLNILVNNASVFTKDDLVNSHDASVLHEFQVNLFSPMTLMRAFAKRCLACGQEASVVNLVDRRVATIDTTCLPYMLSKKALDELTRHAAVELAPAIRVNAVGPGAVLPPPGEGDERVRELAGEAPLEHRCTPADVARTVLYLLEAEAVTGQTIFVDSGQHLVL